MHPYNQGTLPSHSPSRQKQYSPWATLSEILDRLEDEHLLFYAADERERAARAVLVDFLSWCLKDGVQIGTDAATGEIMIRAPYKD